jgi:hypothetical protein
MPAACRSLMKPSSISATMPSTVTTIRPSGPAVLTSGSRIRSDAPFWSSSWTRFSTSRVERPSRSSFVTTRVSPALIKSRMVCNSVRPARLLPETFSSLTISQPAAFKRPFVSVHGLLPIGSLWVDPKIMNTLMSKVKTHSVQRSSTQGSQTGARWETGDPSPSADFTDIRRILTAPSEGRIVRSRT